MSTKKRPAAKPKPKPKKNAKVSVPPPVVSPSPDPRAQGHLQPTPPTNEKASGKRGRGRESTYTKAIADKICARIASSTDSMRRICEEEGMPTPTTVYVWLTKHADFVEQYTRAREAQADLMGDQIVEIADDGTNDFVAREIEKGRVAIVADGEHIQRSRLRVDSRKWLMSKLAPKKYGDKLDVNATVMSLPAALDLVGGKG